MSIKKTIAPDKVQGLSGKKFVKRSFLLIASKLMRVGIQFFILFFYSRKLSYEQYGLYQSIWLYVNILSVFGLFGLPSILLSASNNNIITWIKQHKKNFLVAAFALNTIPLIYFYYKTPGYPITIWLLLITLTIIQNISIVIETLAIKKEKETLVLIANAIFITGYLFSHILIVIYGYSLPILLSAIIFVFLLKSIVLLFDKNLLQIEKAATTTDVGKQWLYLGIFDTISVASNWLDKWLILLLLSFSQFGIYFNGAYEIPLFSLMITAIGNVMVTELSKYNDNKSEANKMMFTNSSLLLASIAFPSFAFLLFYHHDFFTLLFTAKYAASIPIFFITIFILPIRITNYSVALQAYNRNDLIAKAAVIDLLAVIILMLLLYPVLQMKGLALAVVIATYIQTGYYLWQTSELLQEKISHFFPVKKLLILMVLCVAISGTAYWVFSKLPYPINMVGGIVICILLIAGLLYYQLRKNDLIYPLAKADKID
jgi:O-antigen/teichoic acid export membrane protein